MSANILGQLLASGSQIRNEGSDIVLDISIQQIITVLENSLSPDVKNSIKIENTGNGIRIRVSISLVRDTAQNINNIVNGIR